MEQCPICNEPESGKFYFHMQLNSDMHEYFCGKCGYDILATSEIHFFKQLIYFFKTISLRNIASLAQENEKLKSALDQINDMVNAKHLIEQYYPTWLELPERGDQVELRNRNAVVYIGRVVSVDTEKRKALITILDLDDNGKEVNNEEPDKETTINA